MNTKYQMKKTYRIVQILLLCFGFMLSLMRWVYVFNSDFVVINPEITSHVSNFAISLLAYLVIGSTWMTAGVKFRFIVVLGALMVVANFVCETLLSLINTVDIVDAIYGTVGIILALLFFYFVNKYGLIQFDSDNKLVIQSSTVNN